MTEHKITPQTYGMVFGVLLALTILTVILGSAELGAWHGPVGLAIAATKATLIVLFFMHAWGGSRLTWLVVGTSVLWLAILLSLTLSDYLSRGWQ